MIDFISRLIVLHSAFENTPSASIIFSSNPRAAETWKAKCTIQNGFQNVRHRHIIHMSLKLFTTYKQKLKMYYDFY